MDRRIVICDDDQQIHSQITEYLRKMESESGEQFCLTHCFSGEELLSEGLRDVDILLLDIQMGELSGLDAARKLRRESRDTIIILITNLIDCALEGYEIHAFSFLCKPVSYNAFLRCMTDAFQRIDASKPASIALNIGGTLTVVSLGELIYVEVYHHSTTFVFHSDRKTWNIPLSQIEKMTVGKGFFRCHMSYLVNLRFIREIRAASLTMANGCEVPMSKYRRRELISAYSRYVGGSL